MSEATERAWEWISVEERLPELDRSVLLWVGGDGIEGAAISGWRETDPESYTAKEWDNENGADFPPEYSTDEWGKVTHWMPLPKGPTDDRPD